MLVIRRRAGESILVGNDIEIQVLEVTPTRVKLGISAPEKVPVLRKEIRATVEQNLAASRTASKSSLATLLGLLRTRTTSDAD